MSGSAVDFTEMYCAAVRALFRNGAEKVDRSAVGTMRHYCFSDTAAQQQ